MKMANSTSRLDQDASLASFELLGPVGEKLFAPTCVSVSSTGEYVVSDSESCFIVIYSSFGEYLCHFSTIPKSIFYLLLNLEKHRPHDVAWLSSKRVVYTQPWGSKVTISNWNGYKTTCLEGKPLYQPFGVCVDNLDQIYVTDKDKGRILCYSSEGKLIKTFGGLASNGFSLHNPHYIVLNKAGDIVLNDMIKDCVCIKMYDRLSGNFKTVSTNTISGLGVGSLAIDSENNIFMTDYHKNMVKVFRNDSNENHEMNNVKNLCGIALNHDGNLVCIDNHDKTIKIFPWGKDHLHCNGHIKSSLDITIDNN